MHSGALRTHTHTQMRARAISAIVINILLQDAFVRISKKNKVFLFVAIMSEKEGARREETH